MLGWQIYVCRGVFDGNENEETFSNSKDLLATWMTNWNGTLWLDEMVGAGNAKKHSGHGYPNLYTAQAKHILPIIKNGPPYSKSGLVVGEDYVMSPSWSGATNLNNPKLEQCLEEEVLTIAAWDLS